MIDALLHYRFMQYALLSGVISSVVCGVMGVIILHKKLVMLSGGIAHTSYGGIGLGYMLGFEPILGAFGFALASALGIGVIRKKGGGTDAAIALFWSLGMALGILFIALTPGYPPNVEAYLFGSILSVTTSNLLLMAGLSVAVLLVVFAFFNDWKTYIFDEEFSAVRGLKTSVFDFLLLIMVALASVVLIRIGGIVLTLALLTAPAAAADKLVKSFGKQMLFAVLIGLVCTAEGLWLSYALNMASGAAIVLLSVAAYIIAWAISPVLKTKALKARI